MYELRAPAAPLRRYIEHYWFVAPAPGETLDLRVEVFVDARADLIFNFGDAYTRAVIGAAPRRVRRSNLDAQRRQPICIVQRGAVHICGARFQLGGLGPFARAPLSTFTAATVAELAARAAVSARHLDRLFDRYVGIAPKVVGRVLRFQGALRALMRDPGCSLAALAVAWGYYDQAHFVKDFKRFSGGVPRGYRGYFPPAGPTDFAPNVVSFLQDGPAPRR